MSHPAVAAAATRCSGVQKFYDQHQQYLDSGLCMLVQYQLRDLEMVFVPLWVQQEGEVGGIAHVSSSGEAAERQGLCQHSVLQRLYGMFR